MQVMIPWQLIFQVAEWAGMKSPIYGLISVNNF